jgi:hypothetical protein
VPIAAGVVVVLAVIGVLVVVEGVVAAARVVAVASATVAGVVEDVTGVNVVGVSAAKPDPPHPRQAAMAMSHAERTRIGITIPFSYFLSDLCVVKTRATMGWLRP